MHPRITSIQSLQTDVENVCRRIGPLWPLKDFVAVNPFMGLADRPFLEAMQMIERVVHGPALPGPEHFRNMIRAEHIPLQVDDPLRWLNAGLARRQQACEVLTVADWADRRYGTHWNSVIVDEISKWLSSYYDRTQSMWPMPWKEKTLFGAWRRAAELDANPELCGLSNFRAIVCELPDVVDECIAQCCQELNCRGEDLPELLHRELMSVAGWASFAAQTKAENVRDVLAIRLAYDMALFRLYPNWTGKETVLVTPALARHLALESVENTYRAELMQTLQMTPVRAVSGRKELQAVFCIDVRSEPIRRALEQQSPNIETIGFAGFFGLPLAVNESAHCPALIEPSYQIESEQCEHDALAPLRHGAITSFVGVETTGAWFGWTIWKRAFTRTKERSNPALRCTIPLADRVDLVENALKNMSLTASELARVVLICGHGSRTENNPYEASLDCGACGGHKGDINARIATSFMNDPDVREALGKRGVQIPPDTVFVAGLHVTTTNEVELLDDALLTAQQHMQLTSLLQNATASLTEKDAKRRSRDWSEVRPEWGLAGNAAFIAARREKTRGLNLGGRAFLHDYDWRKDIDNSVLQLILTAPVVVASWINLQYYASVVNPTVFGSGNKILHNIVGDFGVWEGNGGDLRTGLPLQSVHDGKRWVHEPLRLQVFIEAPEERIRAVLHSNKHIADLVRNEWILLWTFTDDSKIERVGSNE